MTSERKAFIIFGKIEDPHDKRGLPGLCVEALDKDLLIDDRLGSATTDEEGRFEIRYAEADFQRLFFDEKPDIYLQVKAPDGTVVYTSKNTVRHEAAQVEKFVIQVPREALEKATVEHHRIYFKQLITINPNYFGTAPKKTAAGEAVSVLSFNQSTKYEKLHCVGLYPEQDILEAILEVKLPYGFKGGLCDDGSKEYISFFVDYGEGAGFESAGPPAAIGVHDLVAVNNGHLFYAVRRAFRPKHLENCSSPQIVRLRAILSWESIPTGPNFVPVWGNVCEGWIQIRPFTPPKLVAVASPLAEAMEVVKPLEMIEPLPEKAIIDPPIPDPGPFFSITGNLEAIKEVVEATSKSLAEEKESGKVEIARSDFPQLMEKNPNYFGAISASKEPAKFMADVAKLPPATVEYLTYKFKLDPSILEPVLPTNPKTKYEELTCVGLYPEEDLLEATLNVKLAYGYGGSLCGLGSWEYVAFYIDWGSGGWEHIDTARVRVHNIPDADDKVLSYAVHSRINKIESKLKNCATENIVKVRAILSWNHDPTPYGPHYTPSWGNVLERRIQIRPNSGAGTKPYIELVNEIHVDEIAQSGPDQGYAWDPGDTIPPLDHNRPFGGVIAAWGNVNVDGATYYRFRFSADNGTTWSNVLDPRIARNPIFWFPAVMRDPLDSDGWFSVSQYNADLGNYSLTPLIHWKSHGKNGNHLLRLELADATKTPLPGKTVDVSLQLDNTGIDFFSFGGTPTGLPMVGVAVKDASGHFKKCETFEGNDSVHIYGNFRDDHFRNFDVTVFGGNISASGQPVGSGSFRSPTAAYNDQGIIGAADGGAGQEIADFNLCAIEQTPSKVKCAYGVELRVWDRAIVGYVSGYAFNTTAHGRSGYVTFDWDPAGQC